MKGKKSVPQSNAVLRAVYAKVTGWLAAPRFFYAIVGLLAFQSIWIALTAVYPQAFDENVHFGLIRLHADQWLPFFTGHIPGAEIYGPIARDPSYLYHFLMSLPYRALAALTDNVGVQVIVLRLMNVAIFIWGLIIYRRVLLSLGLSRRLMHAVLLFFVLTPVVVQLAAHINYDNLIFLLTGILFLATIRFWKRLDTDGVVDGVALMQILLIGIFGSIIKYTSLPLFVGVLAIVIYKLVIHYRHHRRDWRRRLELPARAAMTGYIILLTVGSLLFVERIGMNVIRYQSPSPDCAKVLSVAECWSYSPWGRDRLFSQIYDRPSLREKLYYPGVWVHRMVFETMFVISSQFRPGEVDKVSYIPTPPLTVANYTAWTIVVGGFVLLVAFWRKVWAMRYLRYLLLAISFYTVSLFFKNLSMYLHSGEAVAIHGRYMVPMYPVLYAALALGFAWLFDRLQKPKLKTWLLVITLLLFVHGAGLVAWLFRSTPEWYWPRETGPAYHINHTVQDFVHRVIIP